MERPPLSNRQRDILAAIRTSVEQRGYPPSVRELATAAGLSSSSSVAAQLRVLEAQGYITRDHHKPRTLTVVEDAPQEYEYCAFRTDTGDAISVGINPSHADTLNHAAAWSSQGFPVKVCRRPVGSWEEL